MAEGASNGGYAEANNRADGCSLAAVSRCPSHAAAESGVGNEVIQRTAAAGSWGIEIVAVFVVEVEG